MKTNKTENETITKSITISVICNKCGVEEKGEHIADWSSIETWSHQFGYGSKFDTTTVEFELCDTCYQEFIDSFKHSPDIVDQY